MSVWSGIGSSCSSNVNPKSFSRDGMLEPSRYQSTRKDCKIISRSASIAASTGRDALLMVNRLVAFINFRSVKLRRPSSDANLKVTLSASMPFAFAPVMLMSKAVSTRAGSCKGKSKCPFTERIPPNRAASDTSSPDTCVKSISLPDSWTRSRSASRRPIASSRPPAGFTNASKGKPSGNALRSIATESTRVRSPTTSFLSVKRLSA